jgi:glucosamine kinase
VAYYLGIDGGGSKTTCSVADDSSVLATVTAGASNVTRVGEARARQALHQAIRDACNAAGVAPRQIHRACIGVAGTGSPQIADTIRRVAAELIPGEIEVTGDIQIAMAAAFGAAPGVIVIAGTGSIAYGRDAQGKTARAGGWGFATSDEGSAHWIGRTTVTRLLRAIDQAAADQENHEPSAVGTSPLFRNLKAAWNVQTLDEFVRTANSSPDFAALFPAIVAAPDGGDALAQRVLQQAGEELAQLAGIVVRRLFSEAATSPPNIQLAMAGGVFRYSQLVRDVFCSEVRKLDSRLQVNSQVIDPVAGALLIARQGRATK